MINQELFLEALNRNGITFFTGVPDSLLNDFCNCVRRNVPSDKQLIAANEGNAVAAAAGYYLATNELPLVYMQNSGIGNAMNPLVSLADKNVYSVPMVLLIGWRGDPEVSDWAQHKTQGEITPGLMDIMKIPYRVADIDMDIEEITAWAANTARSTSAPVALIAKKGVFSGTKQPITDDSYPMSREDAIGVVLDNIPSDAICLATTGRATRELYSQRELRGESHDNDFLNVGSMGHASSVAMGIAMARPNRRVVCFDGDSAAIMHLGSWTTVSKQSLPNFMHIILNNGAHESVGGQPSAGQKADFTAIARGCGYNTPNHPVTEAQELADAVKKLQNEDGAALIDVRVHKGIRADLGSLKHISHSELINALKENLRS